MGSNRVAYIDLAKGVSMLLVIMIHVGIDCPIPGLYAAKVPMFFLLSGIFFNGHQASFFKKKINTIFVPFITFYLFSYGVFYVLKFFYPPIVNLTEANSIFDLFTQKSYFNGPIWFLLCLFEVEVIFWCVVRICKKSFIIFLASFVFGSLGFYLSSIGFDFPLNLDSACTAMPFFALGYFLSKLNALSWGTRIQNMFLGIILYILVLMFPLQIFMSVNRYSSGIIHFYVIGFVLVISILLFCKAFDSNKLLNYIGRNSLVILCVHHLLYRPIKLLIKDLPLNADSKSFIVW